MKKAFRKNIYRTILKSMGRYLAIFAIIALGVGFFAGLKTTKPSMMETARQFVTTGGLYDFRLMSTWGFEDAELSEIGALSGVKDVEGAVSEDFIYMNSEGEDSVLKAHSITDQVNKLEVTAGRLPEAGNECVLDDYYFGEDMIDKEITISDKNSQETKDSFTYHTYTVTGLVRSPLYMNRERGTTTVGAGKLNAFLYLPLDGFSFDYYEEVYVSVEGTPGAFSEEYNDYIEERTDVMEEDVTTLIEARYQNEVTDARQKISDGEQELEEKVSDAEKELADAKTKLTDGETQLTEGKQELEDAEESLEKSEKELSDGEKALAYGISQYESGISEYQAGLEQYESGLPEYESGRSQYESSLAEYESGRAALEQNRSLYEGARADLGQKINPSADMLTKGQLIGGYFNSSSDFEPQSFSVYLMGLYQSGQLSAETMQSLALTSDSTEASPAYQNITALVTEYKTVGAFEENERQLDTARAQMESAGAQLDESGAHIEDVKAQLDESKNLLDNSRAQIEENKQKLADGRRQLEQGKQEIDEAKQEIAEKEQEIADGWTDYSEGKEELEKETSDARQELEDAKEELADLEEPKVYVLDRNTNVGYALFESDASIVEGVAKVFPIFFFLIAALVCSTTMTRMVDDERTQIGTLRALGYSRGAIFTKYMVYAGSAACLGGLTGFSIGIRLFPHTIWTAYSMLYGFSDLIFVMDIPLLVLSLCVAFLCSAGTTFAACRLELNHTPAELIRPKSPSAGKRILLERIPLLWKKLKFLHKVTARNVFRFKKRMIMMILGIGGCMALVVTGFGVKDSVSNIVDNQYDKILQYQISATYKKEVTTETLENMQEEFGEDIENSAVLLEIAVDAPYKDGVKNVTLMASDDDNLTRSVSFHLDGKQMAAPGMGEVAIDNRLAESLNLSVGDSISFQTEDIQTEPLKVSGIFENYTYYYAYMTGGTYEKYFGEAFEPQAVYLNLSENADEYKMASYIGDMNNITTVSVTSDIRTRVSNTMGSLNYVVMLVIGCAGALAFIVLFNLGNINISERVREIATLKVLGFYPRETGSYVFRENMVLSLIGIAAGIPLGILLHRFVMLKIKIDMVSFEVRVRPISFLYSILAVLCFTLIVDLIMRRKIEKINMAESLKSIE